MAKSTTNKPKTNRRYHFILNELLYFYELVNSKENVNGLKKKEFRRKISNGGKKKVRSEGCQEKAFQLWLPCT